MAEETHTEIFTLESLKNPAPVHEVHEHTPVKLANVTERDESTPGTVNNDEILLHGNDIEVESEVITAEPVKSHEEKARESGWAPKDVWKGDPDEWVDAKEYVARGSFFKKIAKQKLELEEQKATLKEVLKTLSQSEERAYAKALRDVEDGKAHAKQNRDIDAYEHYIKQEQDLTKQYDQKTINKTAQPEVNLFETTEFKEFSLTDPYILKNDVTTDFARHTAQRLSNEWATANPNIVDIKAELNYIRANMRKIHPPERFPELYRESEQAPVNAKVAAPQGGAREQRAANAPVSTQGLDPMQLHIVNKLKRDGLDWKSYVKEAKANK